LAPDDGSVVEWLGAGSVVARDPPECHRHRRQHRHCQQPHRRPAERANQATSCYDADGSAAASRQLFATLTNHASLTATDIYFVA
jgi:hypothetical protein